MFNSWHSSVLKWQIENVCVSVNAMLNVPNLLSAPKGSEMCIAHQTSSILQTPLILKSDRISEMKEARVQGHFND